MKDVRIIHSLRCPGCGDYRGYMKMSRPRLPWWDDYFCKTCGENPLINVKPSLEVRRQILALRALWARELQRRRSGEKRMVYNAGDVRRVAA